MSVMGKLFDLDSPLFSGLNKLADLIYLNILTMICCIPIITIGASMTALNYVALKIVRNEASDRVQRRRVSTAELLSNPVLHDLCPSVSKAFFRRLLPLYV